MGVLLSTVSFAATKSVNPHEVHEQGKIREVVNIARDAMLGQKNFTDETTSSCLMAFGHKLFCQCLSSELPGTQSFDSYIFFTTMSEEDVNHPGVKQDDRELALNARHARDVCVKQLAE